MKIYHVSWLKEDFSQQEMMPKENVSAQPSQPHQVYQRGTQPWGLNLRAYPRARGESFGSFFIIADQDFP